MPSRQGNKMPTALFAAARAVAPSGAAAFAYSTPSRGYETLKTMIESSDIELEDERMKHIAALAREKGVSVADLAARNGPGGPGCHEAMHTTSIVLDLVDQHLVHHPAIAANGEWFRLASRASEALFNLYQSMGSAHLDRQTGADGIRPEDLNASNDD